MADRPRRLRRSKQLLNDKVAINILNKLSNEDKKIFKSLSKEKKELFMNKIGGLKGSGRIKDKLSSLLKKIKNIPPKFKKKEQKEKNIDEERSIPGKITGAIRSKIINTSRKNNEGRRNPNWDTEVFPREKFHAIFKSRNNSGYYNAQFMGPGTELIKRVEALWAKHGGDLDKITDPDNFVNFADYISFLHDINYTLALTKPIETQRKLIREADLHMRKQLQKEKAKGNFEAKIADKFINLKIKFENLGGKMYPISKKINKLDDDILSKLNQIKDKLISKGAGKIGGNLSREVKLQRINETDPELLNIIEELVGRGIPRDDAITSVYNERVASRYPSEPVTERYVPSVREQERQLLDFDPDLWVSINMMEAMTGNRDAAVKALYEDARSDIYTRTADAAIKSLRERDPITTDYTEDIIRDFVGKGKKIDRPLRPKKEEPPKKGKGPSKWMLHIKDTQDKLGCSYKEAMREASKTWKK